MHARVVTCLASPILKPQKEIKDEVRRGEGRTQVSNRTCYIRVAKFNRKRGDF